MVVWTEAMIQSHTNVSGAPLLVNLILKPKTGLGEIPKHGGRSNLNFRKKVLCAQRFLSLVYAYKHSTITRIKCMKPILAFASREP